MSCKSWTYPETQALLDIWQQEHIQTQLTLMARNRPVWEQVAEIMKFRKGFSRTGEQCKTRIHTLKIRYNRAKKFGLSGPEAEKECPFYRQLDAVLGKNWIRKDSYLKSSISASAASAASITSLYPLTFANDLENTHFNMSKPGMIQILPKPIPKYGESPFKSHRVEEDKIEDILGEHTKLIKKVLSGLSVRKDSEQDDSTNINVTEESQFNELLKSLVSTSSSTLGSSDKTAFKSPSSNASGSPNPQESVSPMTVTSTNVTESDDVSVVQVSKRRKIDEHNGGYSDCPSGDQMHDHMISGLFGTLAQIVSHVSEIAHSIKQVKETENKNIRELVELYEKRADVEREHYKTVEHLLTTLVQAVTKTDTEMTMIESSTVNNIKVE